MGLEELRNRHDELYDFLSRIDSLRDDCKSKDLKEELEYLLYEAGYDDELKELEQEINKLEDEEEKQANLEFERSRI